jgi:hypothetical protein
MMRIALTRLTSTIFLVLASALVMYGLFGLSHFEWYRGEYTDERLILFDNGIYPFAWGVGLLVIGQFCRLHYRIPAMLFSGITALSLLLWKRATVPLPIAGQSLFPDSDLLNELLIISAVVTLLALVDGIVGHSMRNARRGALPPADPKRHD